MTFRSCRRHPYSPLSTHTNIMDVIKRDHIEWFNKSAAIHMQQRALFRQSFYKYHRYLQADKAGIAVWCRRSYLQKEGVNR